MWKWEVVLFCFSKNEKVVITGSGYDRQDVATWEMRNWLKKILPCFFLFRVISSEVKESVR